MRIRALCFGLLATSFCFASVTPAAADILIVVDKPAQRMSVSVDGVPHYSWKVSTGRRGYETPSGSYRPFRLERDYYSREWDDAPMPNDVFFTPLGHAIHGSYDTSHLGTPVSHGCIRLAPENAALLFSLVEAEGLTRTKVIVAGGPKGAARPFGAPARPRLFAPPPLWPDEAPRGFWTTPLRPPAYQGPVYGDEYDGDGW